MKKADNLSKIRQQFREKIEGSSYATVLDRLLMRLGYLYQAHPNMPLYTEINAFILTLAGTGLTALILFLAESTDQAVEDFLIFLPVPLIVYLGIVGTRKYWKMAMSIVSNNLLETMDDLEAIRNLESWLRSWASHRAELTSGILFVVVIDGYFYLLAALTGEIIPRTPVTIAFLPMFLLMGMLFYDFFRAIFMPIRIRQYQLRLYKADPASAEIIGHLAGLFTALNFLIATIAGILTLLMAIFNPLPITGSVFVIAIAWIPLLTAFVITQSALRRIIQNGKQRTLNEIQSKIEKLQAKENIPSEETLKHIRALIDYHDYVKSRRNSTFDFQTGLNFLNSLLFPVIGFLLGNLKEFLAFFSK